MGSVLDLVLNGLGLAVTFSLLALAFRYSRGGRQTPAFATVGYFLAGSAVCRLLVWAALAFTIIPQVAVLAGALPLAAVVGLITSGLLDRLRNSTVSANPEFYWAPWAAILFAAAGLLEFATGLKPPPSGNPNPAEIPAAGICVVALGIMAFAAAFHLIRKTRWGKELQAITQNRQCAELLGIDVAATERLAAFVAGALAACAGGLAAALFSPSDWTGYLLLPITALLSAWMVRAYPLGSAVAWSLLIGGANAVWAAGIGWNDAGMVLFAGLMFVLTVIGPILGQSWSVEQA